ncbi:hypothetical protein GCM10017783_23630 [Deinococcus piscis]|uniref:ABC transporter permease n=1 Tax=Deinococcus piscis TaxID=394230 RepID=A0ABQ3KH40_9DEIO|nr:ABC transporter permease [Deinococcus piscis]GHG10468.1 hypothetical protein GCM10017783_23630 [Deinococcus piscis]
MRLLKLEFLKLRRTLVWPVALSLPLVPAVMNTVIHHSERFQKAEWADVLQNGLNTWHLMLMPLVLSLLVAWVLGSEHSGGGWRLNFAAPRPRRSVPYAKMVLLLFLSLVMATLMLLSVGLSALSLPSLTGSPDWAAFVWGGLRGWVGSVELLLVLFLTALRFPSFLAPIGLGMAGMVVGFMGINSDSFGPWWPWTFPTLLSLPGQDGKDLQFPGAVSVVVALACWALSLQHVRRQDA